MVACKLDKLATEFTPERITLHVELVPADGDEFDEPLDSAASKLDACANYARSTFGVRTAKADEPVSTAKAGPPEKTIEERRAVVDARVMRVLEKNVREARDSGDTTAIAKAESALDMHKRAVKDREKEAKEK